MSTARGERRISLQATRSILYKIPLNEYFELPGRPHVVYQLRTYANAAEAHAAAQQARADIPFLFKSFETGQIGPKRMAKMHGGKPRMATIHEYLDWTVTAAAAEEDDELDLCTYPAFLTLGHLAAQDFSGFRVLTILPRYISHWPAPDAPGNVEGTKAGSHLGAPKPPLPLLQSHSKPVCAATIRTGPGYLEVPFVATHETKRGRGYCRCLVEALEAIARALDIGKVMLCSTNDASVKSTWSHLGFSFTSDQQMDEWDIPHSDLVYLQNTTQMHKDIPPTPKWRPVVIKHELFRQRVYVQVDGPRHATLGPPKAPKLPSTKEFRPVQSEATSGVTDSNISDTSMSQLARPLEAASAAGPAKGPGMCQPRHSPEHAHASSAPVANTAKPAAAAAAAEGGSTGSQPAAGAACIAAATAAAVATITANTLKNAVQPIHGQDEPHHAALANHSNDPATAVITEDSAKPDIGLVTETLVSSGQAGTTQQDCLEQPDGSVHSVD